MIRNLRLISDRQNTLHVFNSIYGVYYVVYINGEMKSILTHMK